MKKALLAYGYGLKNAGDMAITLGAIDLLKKNYKVAVLSRFDENHPEYERSRDFIISKYPECTVLPSPFKLNRNADLKTKIKDHFSGGLKVTGIIEDDKIDSLIESSDLVAFNGGNLFRCESFSDFARLIALMYPLNKARSKEVPYLVLPQSASDINFFGKALLGKTLKEAQKVWCREDITEDYLKQKFHIQDIESSIDLAFYLEKDSTETKVEGNKNKRIAITTRSHTVGDLGAFDEKKKSRIENIILNTLKSFEGSEFVFVIQTKKDIEITNRIARKADELFGHVTIYEEYDPVKLIEYYKSCNALLGMRLHSIILALNAGTPCTGFFAREWGFKNPGIMGQFDLPFKYIDNDNFSDFSTELENILNNEDRLREQIQHNINEEQNKLISSF